MFLFQCLIAMLKYLVNISSINLHLFLLLLSVKRFLALGVVLISSLLAALLLCSETELFTEDVVKLSAPLSVSISSSMLFSLFCSRSFTSDVIKDAAASLKLLWKLISCEEQGGDSVTI